MREFVHNAFTDTGVLSRQLGYHADPLLIVSDERTSTNANGKVLFYLTYF